MNNASGSSLQKANFALLVLILGCLAYLIVRERVRSEQRAAEAEAAAAANARISTVRTVSAPWPSDLKSSFSPLRARNETNTARVVPRPAAVGPNENPAAEISSGTTPPAVLVESISATPGVAVPVATSSETRGAVNHLQISGHVKLRGVPPSERVITLDTMCARLHTEPLKTRFFVVGENGGLADTFVYIKAGASGQSWSVSPGVLDQVNCEYQPYVMGVQAGREFIVRNSDSFMHNVHAVPNNSHNKERNVAQSTNGTETRFVFNAPEIFVQFKCEVHPWMFAYVGVVAHPWFAVTDKNGGFTLPPGLPAGTYTFAAVHRKAGEVTHRITIHEGENPEINFTLDVPKELAKAEQP
jgi:plastocyanin